jgi:tetraacyldisaccharide 4'-kinase
MKAIRFLLFPFAVLYDLITSLRNLLYNKGIFKSTVFDLPIIAVGNLNVGGTGKSPQIEYLIRLLQNQFKVAVLSRGYKRKTTGYVLIDSTHSAEDVGDEPLQFFKKFPKISAAVDANRVNGIQQLQSNVNPEVILLDDAFQHRKVKAGFYILLTKYGDLYANDFLLPTGNLRESRAGVKRAHVIVVTKCPQNLSKAEQERIQKKLRTNANQAVFFSTISYHSKTKGFQQVSLENLKDYEVVLVTGIANPKPLLNFLNEQQVKVQHLEYPDHHNFSAQEIQKIKSVFDDNTSAKKILLTTEKDYMRLSDKISSLSYIEIESAFLSNKENFDKIVLSQVKE